MQKESAKIVAVLSPYANLFASDGEWFARPGSGSQVPPDPVSALESAVLEAFVYVSDKASAFQLLLRAELDPPPLPDAPKFFYQSYGIVPVTSAKPLLLRPRHILCRSRNGGLVEIATCENPCLVLRPLFSGPRVSEPVTQHRFDELVDGLEARGLLVPPPGSVDFGSFRRTRPLCRDFGFSRGTPIDRYYLNAFINEIRNSIRGSAMEVGGSHCNRDRYGFIWADSYVAMDSNRGPEIDFVGDVLNPELFAADSFDAIVSFNVMEHVPKPWLAIENLYRWVRKGGCVATMVPSVQRVHLMPGDYWRMLPSALAALHSSFAQQTSFVYGNALTSVAAIMGLCAEDLCAEELNVHDPDYPVASCVLAIK